MKTLYIPLAILALLLVFSLWSAAYVAQQVEQCTQILQRSADLAAEESWDEAEAQLQRSYESWHTAQAYFHAIMEHEELDEAELFFAAAFAACAERDDPDFHAILSQLQTSLQHLSEKQQISLNNIL